MSGVLQALVRNGRLVLDVPTDLPEGEVVSLRVVDEDLSEQQREALHRSLRRGIGQLKAGDGIDGDEFLAKIRSPRA